MTPDLLGTLLPLALGVAISPIPLVALAVVLLSSPSWRPGAGFAAGWVAGIVGVLVVLGGLASSLPDLGGGTAPGSGVASVVLGVLVLVVAGAQGWRVGRRRRAGAGATSAASWANRSLDAVSALTAPRAALVGLVMSLNPKSLAVGASATLQLDAADLDAGPLLVAAAAYTAVAASTVVAPVVARVVAGDRFAGRLDAARTWLQHRADLLTVVVLALVGVVLVVRGVTSL